MKTCLTCGVRYPDALEFCPQDGTALPGGPPARTQPLFDRFLGTVIDGRYKIEAKLGEGGMGVVYAARHVIIDKRVAIKVLKKEAQAEDNAAERFIREARATSRIGHANIVDITDFGTLPDGSAYFVMEFLDGKTLGNALEDGPLPALRAIGIAAQMARGLHAAHKNSVIHRDLKPENIFLIERDGQPDQVKIVDFGIAKLQDGGAATRLTQAGMVLGTPEYMAPEAATGKETDHRVDEYSLGCILYEMLTGDVPFRGSNSAATLTKHVFEPVEPPSRRKPELHIPPNIEAVTLKAMAKKPDERYATMLDFLEALDGAAAQLSGKVAIARTAPPRAPREPTAPSRLQFPDEVLPPPPRTSTSRWALPLVAVALLGAAGVVLAVRARRPPPAVVATPVVEPPVPAPPPVEVAPPPPAEPPPPPSPPPRPDNVTLTLHSTPAGATVFRGGERVGVTPVVFQHAAGSEPLELTFKLPGYKDHVRSIVPSSNQYVEVALVRKSRSGSRDSTAPRSRGSGLGSGSDLRDPFK